MWQVLPVERLQLLNRVHRIDEYVARAPFLQVAGTEGEQVGIEQAAQLDLHQRRSAVADQLLGGHEDRPHEGQDDQPDKQRQDFAERTTLKDHGDGGAGKGQPRDANERLPQSAGGRQPNPQAHTLRQTDQPQVDVTFHGGGSVPSFPQSGYPQEAVRGVYCKLFPIMTTASLAGSRCPGNAAMAAASWE